MFNKAFSLNDAAKKNAGPKDRNFALDHRHVRVFGGEDRFYARRFFALPLEQNLGGCRVERRLAHQERDPDHQNQGSDSSGEFPLTPQKAEYLAQVEERWAFLAYRSE